MPIRAFLVALFWVLVSLAILAAAPPCAFADPWTDVQPLLRNNQYQEAEALLESAVVTDPEDGRAWYGLGLTRHSLEDLDGAVEANRRAADLPHMRPDALYNLACAYALKGEGQLAALTLMEAQDAGFVDFDLMQSDPDLESLRQQGQIRFPESRSYDTFRAPNGVSIRYRLELPDDHDPEQAYPALVSFAPGGWGAASNDWALEQIWGESTRKHGWIAVHLLAPDQGWMTHPSHHALEDLLDMVRARHPIEGGQFHLVGVENGGRPAATYAGMSGEYFQTLTTVGTHAYDRWDDDDLASFRQDNIHLLVAAGDGWVRSVNERTAKLMRQGGAKVSLTILEGNKRIPDSLRDGGLMRLLDETVRAGRS